MEELGIKSRFHESLNHTASPWGYGCIIIEQDPDVVFNCHSILCVILLCLWKYTNLDSPEIWLFQGSLIKPVWHDVVRQNSTQGDGGQFSIALTRSCWAISVPRRMCKGWRNAIAKMKRSRVRAKKLDHIRRQEENRCLAVKLRSDVLFQWQPIPLESYYSPAVQLYSLPNPPAQLLVKCSKKWPRPIWGGCVWKWLQSYQPGWFRGGGQWWWWGRARDKSQGCPSLHPALPHLCSSLATVRERSVSLVKKKNIAPQVELFMLWY